MIRISQYLCRALFANNKCIMVRLCQQLFDRESSWFVEVQEFDDNWRIH